MKTINALERGLDVLRKLDERHGQSLAELHAATGIPKPSLLRILDTLEASGFAWRAIGDGRYRRRFALILRPSLADELLVLDIDLPSHQQSQPNPTHQPNSANQAQRVLVA